MTKLFGIYIGGMAPGCHVELHDMRFAIGETIDDCIPALKAQWWGIPESLHLDAWGPIEWADGYAVSVEEGPAPQRDETPKLFLANMGGYDPALFTELHENFFIAAEDARAARRMAVDRIKHWTSPHKDAILECEAVVDIAAAIDQATPAPERHVRLTPDPSPRSFAFEARYVPIGRT